DIQPDGDRRRQQRLQPDAHEATHFPGENGDKRHPLLARLHPWPPPAPLAPTSDTNSSSRRLALLRMLTTWICCAARLAKSSLRERDFSTSTSSEWPSIRRPA